MGVSVPLVTMEAAAAYRECRERITEMVRAAGPSAEQTRVPACPDWTAKDLVAHLTGVCADILQGRLEGVGTDEWTAAQVEARRSRGVEEVLGEWEEVGAQIDALLPSFPEWAANQTVFDTLSHEHDLADAFGLPAPAKVQAEGPALAFAATALTARAETVGAPPLTVISDGREWSSSGEGPGATLRLEPVDLLRSVTGRRTPEEIASLDWGGADPSAWLAAFEIGHFKLRDTPIS